MSETTDAVFDYVAGSLPLLISVPHDGRLLVPGQAEHMSPAGLDLPDTDWFVAELYDFVKKLGAYRIVARYSRYAIDLNRPADDEHLYDGQVATGLCPSQTFSGHDVYLDGASVTPEEMQRRVDGYWTPYHQAIAATLDEMRAEHGYALLWDAHSIPSVVPRLFGGELPELNIGSYDGKSIESTLCAAVSTVAEKSTYSTVVNGRFKGGHITRFFGRPSDDIHALQLEIAQRAYMDEDARQFVPAKARKLRGTLRAMIEALLDAARRHYR